MPTNSKLHSYVHQTQRILWGWKSRLRRPPPTSTTPDGNTLQLNVGQSSQPERQVLSDTLCIAGGSMHDDMKAKPSVMMVMQNTFSHHIMFTDISPPSLSCQIHPRVISMKYSSRKHNLPLTMYKLNRSPEGMSWPDRSTTTSINWKL